MNVRIYEKPLF